MHIPFRSLDAQHNLIRSEIEESFRKVLNGNRFILGAEVLAFEREFAAYCGVKHCIAVANGSDALFISLKLLGVGPGDEVIVPALTCAPTWMAVSRTGATAVAVDADDKTFMLDTAKVRVALSRKTKAIVPVNLFGHPADLHCLNRIATEGNASVIEDNAQAHGARIGVQRTGSFGLANATSFYPTKNLGALGDGGAITTNDTRLAEEAAQYRNYGSTKRFYHAGIGVNSRLDELQAAILRVKLRNLDKWNELRRKIAGQYLTHLARTGDLTFPVPVKESEPVYHLFVTCTEKRDQLRDFLLKNGVETDVHYPVPPHMQDAFSNSGYSMGDFPIAERICNTILSLPLWPGMTDEQVSYVCKAIANFYKR